MKALNKDLLLWTDKEKAAWDRYAHEIAVKAEYAKQHGFVLPLTVIPNSNAHWHYLIMLGDN